MTLVLENKNKQKVKYVVSVTSYQGAELICGSSYMDPYTKLLAVTLSCDPGNVAQMGPLRISASADDESLVILTLHHLKAVTMLPFP